MFIFHPTKTVFIFNRGGENESCCNNGASRDIGEAIARSLAKDGYGLALGARSIDRLENK